MLDSSMPLDTMSSESLTWPNQRVEAWKFTSLAHLAEVDFIPAEQTAQPFSPADIKGYGIDIVAGRALPEVVSMPTGIEIKNIFNDSKRLCQALDRLPESHFLRDLSASRHSSASVISVAAGLSLDLPIVLNFTGGTAKEACYPFILLEIGEGARLRLAEYHHSCLGLSCPLFLCSLGDKARLDHIKLQDDSKKTSHLSLSHFTLGTKSQLNSFSLARGGALSRLESHCLFTGSDAHFSGSAIYLGTDKQHHDITSFVAHEQPSCCSEQVIHGVLDDNARGVFQGKVRVAPDAQKTDGRQMNRTLLLSSEAEADAKPELEIFADDVACAHGATIGALDEHLLFYLASRGIDKKTAQTMLIDAFVADGLAQIDDKDFAAYLGDKIAEWSADNLYSKNG